MSTGASDPAGAIAITLSTRGERVARVRLASTRRTDFSRRLFAGKGVDQLLGTLPLVFSVCATAQTSAAVQAVEHAAGHEVDARHAHAREVLVLAETIREHLFRILLGWPGWLGLPPPGNRLSALGRMRAAWSAALYPAGDAFRPGGGRLTPQRKALQDLRDDIDDLLLLALGCTPDEWFRIVDGAALRAWATASDAVAPRMIRSVVERGLERVGASPVRALPALDDDALAARFAGPGADAFVAAPVWDGAPRETGALQRQADHALVAALQAEFGNGLLSRQVARLVELVACVAAIDVLLGDLGDADAGDVPVVSDGSGLAQVDAARGLLVHCISLDAGLVSNYRILAPTEWNFHPDGALAAGLLGLHADAHVAELARLLVDAVDPCVESRVEVRDDA